jgi:hypothetical protein
MQKSRIDGGSADDRYRAPTPHETKRNETEVDPTVSHPAQADGQSAARSPLGAEQTYDRQLGRRELGESTPCAQGCCNHAISICESYDIEVTAAAAGWPATRELERLRRKKVHEAPDLRAARPRPAPQNLRIRAHFPSVHARRSLAFEGFNRLIPNDPHRRRRIAAIGRRNPYGIPTDFPCRPDC